jgi:hypothetical protein
MAAGGMQPGAMAPDAMPARGPKSEVVSAHRPLPGKPVGREPSPQWSDGNP